MFVCTANSLNIPTPLLDRMEIIRIPGYIEDEKINIASKYLLPKQMERNGLKEKEINFIDAPVSGGPKGANQGNIAVMVGGSESQFAEIKPIMDAISSNIFYAGKIGSGHSIKAGNNLLNLICRMATFEVISLLVKDGVDPKKAVEIIQKSSGRNYATEITLPDNILSGKMIQGFSTGLMKKDAGVATKIANLNQVEIPLGKLSQKLLQNTIDEFGEDADMSNVALTFEKLSGAKIRP